MPNYRQVARQKAQKYGLDPNIFERQIQQESGFNPNVTSPAGAIGIAQIMPATAKGWGVNPRDPVASLDAAARNMAQYVKQYGGYKNALVAYNAGPGRVGGALPAETQAYVRNILSGSRSPRSSTVHGAAGGGTRSGGNVGGPSTGTGDTRTALALSLLGVSSDYGVDPLQLAITAALQRASTGSPTGATRASGGATQPQGRLNTNATTFDGKPVAAWIVPILKRARATGLWKGSVTSGVRTKQQQLAAAQHYGLQHYPNGPLASNHVEGHNGAVDVSDPQGLQRALQRLGVTNLKNAMPEDPVHFSRNGH